MEHNAADALQFGYWFQCSRFSFFAPHGSCGALGRRQTRLVFPRFRPFGHPPSLAFARAARAFAGVEMLPRSAAGFISPPQCGHFTIPSPPGCAPIGSPSFRLRPC